MHPLFIYNKDADGNLQHYSLCFISDDNTLDTSFAHKIQTLLVEFLKQRLPNVSKIYYYSDGCGGQYKNFKNFLNLCSHKEDFSIKAEWIFFATSHGKSPYDGIGGAVKRHAAKRKRSLQIPLSNRILDYRVVLEVCQEEMKSIIPFLSRHHKLDTNCAVGMTRLWISMTSKFQLELILAILHHRLTSLLCTVRCEGSVW